MWGSKGCRKCSVCRRLKRKVKSEVFNIDLKCTYTTLGEPCRECSNRGHSCTANDKVYGPIRRRNEPNHLGHPGQMTWDLGTSFQNADALTLTAEDPRTIIARIQEDIQSRRQELLDLFISRRHEYWEWLRPRVEAALGRGTVYSNLGGPNAQLYNNNIPGSERDLNVTIHGRRLDARLSFLFIDSNSNSNRATEMEPELGRVQPASWQHFNQHRLQSRIYHAPYNKKAMGGSSHRGMRKCERCRFHCSESVVSQICQNNIHLKCTYTAVDELYGFCSSCGLTGAAKNKANGPKRRKSERSDQGNSSQQIRFRRHCQVIGITTSRRSKSYRVHLDGLIISIQIMVIPVCVTFDQANRRKL